MPVIGQKFAVRPRFKTFARENRSRRNFMPAKKKAKKKKKH
jgi:hypothetical protein